MKVFVAGATGAIGKQLVPMLVADGHEVTAMTRTPAKADAIRSLGARPAIADALDPEAVAQAVGRGRAGGRDPRAHRHRRGFLRRAASTRCSPGPTACGRREPITCSRRQRPSARVGSSRRASPAGPSSAQAGPSRSEDDPLQEHPPKTVTETLGAISHLERDRHRAPRGSRDSPSATAASTVPGPRSP